MFDQAKRELSQEEIDERTKEVLALMRLNDSAEGEIAGHTSEIKRIKERISIRTSEARLLRHEIEQGYIWEDVPPPQQKLPLEDPAQAEASPLDVLNEKLAGLAGQAPAGTYDVFEQMYSLPTTMLALSIDLKEILTDKQSEAFFTDQMEPIVDWHPESGIFDAVARWTRVELAHRQSQETAQAGETPTAGLTIPARYPMPEKLLELVGDPKAKKKRAKKAAGG